MTEQERKLYNENLKLLQLVEQLKKQNVENKMYADSRIEKAIDKWIVNISKDKFISKEAAEQIEGLKEKECFSKVVKYICENKIVKGYRTLCKNFLANDRLISEYEVGRLSDKLDYKYKEDCDETRWREMGYTLTELNGEILAYIYVLDIDVEKNSEIELKYRAEYDGLTKLYNRQTALTKIQDILYDFDFANEYASLIIIDVDNFKSINDTYGHKYGDEVLTCVAQKIKIFFRTSDIIGRLGGDEFIVFCKDISKDLLEIKFFEMCKSNLKFCTELNQEVFSTLSIGIAMIPKDGEDLSTLYANADKALYQSKSKGKNTYTFYNSEKTVMQSQKNRVCDAGTVIDHNLYDNLELYVLKTLFNSNNKKVAIKNSLEVLCETLFCQIAYIAVGSKKNDSWIVPFFWSTNEYEKTYELNSFIKDQISRYIDNENHKSQIQVMASVGKPVINCYKGIELLAYYYLNGENSRFLFVIEKNIKKAFTQKELEMIKTSAQVIAMFLEIK